jgi:predicted small lipoprotein YifL
MPNRSNQDRALRAGAWLLAFLLLAACGQRGPLVLPEAPPASSAADDDVNDDEDEGER